MQPYPPMGPGAGPGPGPGQPGPYSYPYQYPYPPMPPSGPRTLGLLSIIFGSVVAAQSFLGAIIGGAGMAWMTTVMKGLPGNSNLSAMEDYIHAIRLPSLLQGLVLLGMSIWLLLIGVGQRRYRAWAGRHSVIWGVLGLVVLVGMAVMYVAVTGPAAARMMAEMTRHAGAPNPMGPMMRWAGIGGVLIYAPYPIILIVTFRKPAIVSAMTS